MSSGASPTQQSKTGLRLYAAVFLGYAVVALMLSYPILSRSDAQLLGAGETTLVRYWSEWAVGWALQNAAFPLPDGLLGHPLGVASPYDAVSWADGVLLLGFGAFVDPPTAHDLTVLLHIALSGLSMFALSRRISGSSVAGFVAGLAYAFWPFRLLDSSSPAYVAGEGLPLLMLTLLQLGQRRATPSVRWGALAGIVVALIGYTEPRMLILALAIAGCYVIYLLLFHAGTWGRAMWGGGLAAAVTASVLLIPVVWSIDGVVVAPPEPLAPASVTTGEGVELFDYLVPHSSHPLSLALHQETAGDTDASPVAFVGFAVLALGVTGVVQRQAPVVDKPFWVGLALICLTLALGPSLRLVGVDTGLPLPYSLLEPWIDNLHLVGARSFLALLALPSAALAGSGTASLAASPAKLKRSRCPASAAAVTAVVSTLVLVDFVALPLPASTVAIPDFYRLLGRQQAACAIVELPAEPQASAQYLLYQTTHGLPLANGLASPSSASDASGSGQVPLIAELESGGINTDLADISRQVSALRDAGLCYVVVHKDLAEPDDLLDWSSYLAEHEYYERDAIVVYSTEPLSVSHLPAQADLGQGIVLLRADLKPNPAYVHGDIEVQAYFGAISLPGPDVSARIWLEDAQARVVQSEVVPLSVDWPVGDWTSNAIVRARYVLRIGPDAVDGEHTVYLSLVRGTQARVVGQKGKAGMVHIITADLPPSIPVIDPGAEPTFGGVLQLLDHDVQVVDGTLLVILDWQALADLDVNYKVFVHVYAATNEPPVAQADVMPHDWTYPTAWWSAGERVSDELRIPLSHLAPGPYQVALGVYDPATGVRLEVGNLGSEGEGVDRALLEVIALP